jgi:hypothetical protein
MVVINSVTPLLGPLLVSSHRHALMSTLMQQLKVLLSAEGITFFVSPAPPCLPYTPHKKR